MVLPRCTTAVFAGLISVVLASVNAISADESLGLRVPPGFTITRFADDDLAHDIHCLTIDSLGRVVVSGPGYIKTLIDHDNDGRADEAIPFAQPASGAQGMCFFGSDLIATAEGGIVRYQDRDGDSRADGPPDVFLKLATGGEHDAHAVRRGPDGWWYVITGNVSGIDDRYISTKTSPVRDPRAGVLMRLAPDLGDGEIVAHGFRNAYDFTFDAIGEIFTCDSDGERDVSLPWYLPSRVLHVFPGCDAGWVTESWKRRTEFFDMAPMVASVGRNSPTGVICYRHSHFPSDYHSALFVLDWTFGKVQVLKLRQQGSSVQSEPVDFITAEGAHGFAPTSGAIGPDGSLYISVGGRGTRGSVYRVQVDGRPVVNLLNHAPPKSVADKVTLCLRCPDPLSSWARRVWEPLAREVGSQAFIQAAEDEQRPTIERLRAIEILTEKFHGLDSDLLATLARSPRPAVRARAAWSTGRTQPHHPRTPVMALLLADREPFVVRTALDALLGSEPELLADLVTPLATALASPDRYVRQSAVRVVARTDEDTYQEIAVQAAATGWQAGISLAAAYSLRNDGIDPYTIDVAMRVLSEQHPLELRREAVRLLQLGLGDCGPAPKAAGRGKSRPAVYDAYATPLDLMTQIETIAALRKDLPAIYPSGDPELDHELTRTLAMIQVSDASLIDRILQSITAGSHPIDDLHHLIVVSRMTGERTPSQRERIAEAIVQLDAKVTAHKLIQDLHWTDRVLELYAALVKLDPQLPVTMLQHKEFGRPAHAQYLTKLHSSHFETAVNLFSRAAVAGGDAYQWNSDVVYLLSHSTDERVRKLVRDQFENFGLRGAVLLALADRPLPADRELFVTGLDSSQFDVLGACIRALSLLPPSPAAHDNVMLLKTLRRLGLQGEEAILRDQVADALRRNLGQTAGYELGRLGDPQTAAIQQWTQIIQQMFPQEYALHQGDGEEELVQLTRRLAAVDWTLGDHQRGEKIFRQRACVQCHGSGGALGPDLTGIAGRFSREDLFIAIALPSRDVSPRYQSELIVTETGESITGLVVYEAVDGLVMRDAQNRTYRLDPSEIEVRRKLTASLMPAGLLNDLGASDLADLYAYLEHLSQQRQVQTAEALDDTRK